MAESISRESYSIIGLPGAPLIGRIVGTVSGIAPTTGNFQVGDFIIDQAGGNWTCTISGSPGTWIKTGPFTGGSIGSTTISGSLTISGSISYGVSTVSSGIHTGGSFTYPLLAGSMETVYIVGTAIPSVANITLNSGSVWLYNSNAANTFTINITTSGTINTLLSTGQAITSTVIVQQGASPASYYATQIQIDGTNITPYWQNATAPASGLTVNGLDVYTFTAIKTAANTYYTLASQTKF